MGKELVTDRRIVTTLTPEKKVYRGIAIIMLTILSCYAFRFLVHFHATVKP